MAISSNKSSRFCETLSSQVISVGIDVHKKSYSVCLYRSDGLSEVFSMPSDNSKLISILNDFRECIVKIAYEAGPTGFKLARDLIAEGYDVIVAAPSRIPRPVSPSNKTDNLDAKKLAEYAMSGLIKSVAIPTVEEEAYRRLVRRRNQVTDSIRRVKQRIKAVLLSFSIKEPDKLTRWAKSAVEELRTMDIPCRDTLDSLMRELDFMKYEQSILDEQIAELTEEHKARNVKALHGVGQIVASNFLAEIFKPERFDRAEEVTAYLGLAPMISQSGSGKAKTRIRPVGQQRLRSMIIESAWIWRSKDEEAMEFYNRILSRTGLPQKAIVALARKLAVRMWKQAVKAA
jgi:transposase